MHPFASSTTVLWFSGITRFLNPLSGSPSMKLIACPKVFGTPNNQWKQPTMAMMGHMKIAKRIILTGLLLFSCWRPMAQGDKAQYHMQLPPSQVGNIRIQPMRLQIFISGKELFEINYILEVGGGLDRKK